MNFNAIAINSRRCNPSVRNRTFRTIPVRADDSYLFNLEDYPQVVNYHSQQVIHHAREAARYAKEYKEKTAIQLHLPFDESAILLD